MIYDDNGKIKNNNPTSTLTNESILTKFNREYENYAQASNTIVERPVPKNTTVKKDNEE